jgi:hypothetical protein
LCYLADMTLLSEADALDAELQRAATGATIHRFQNLRSLVRMATSLAEHTPTEENIEEARRIMKFIRTHCLTGCCPCASPCSSYEEEQKRLCKR